MYAMHIHKQKKILSIYKLKKQAKKYMVTVRT